MKLKTWVAVQLLIEYKAHTPSAEEGRVFSDEDIELCAHRAARLCLACGDDPESKVSIEHE